MKVILVSANTDDVSEAELRRAGISAVLRKPFSLAQLEAAARAGGASTRPGADAGGLPA